MHGVILLELESYVTQALGKEGWKAVRAEAGLEKRVFVHVDAYPDEEFNVLLGAAARRLDKPARLLLEEFGMFVAPRLLKTYRFLVKNEWKVLDLLSNVEPVMHAAVRRRAPLAEPPRLSVERQSEREVLIVYNSPRKLCEFARGLIEGLALFFDEDVRISETACMHDGAVACRLLVTKR